VAAAEALLRELEALLRELEDLQLEHLLVLQEASRAGAKVAGGQTAAVAKRCCAACGNTSQEHLVRQCMLQDVLQLRRGALLKQGVPGGALAAAQADVQGAAGEQGTKSTKSTKSCAY
jgi:hypothetical protein